MEKGLDKLILFISFDLDAESAEIYRKSDPNTLSRGRFAIHRGVYKVLEVLKKYRVKSTFFTPSWVIEQYPEIIEEIVSNEHEIAAHGYLHERLDQLSYDEELEVFRRTDNIFKEIVGYQPLGFRSPYWRWSRNTINILVKHGYRYDSSLMDDEYPYILKRGDYEILELPVDWRLDDWPYLEYYRSLTPEDLLKQWMDELEYARKHTGYLSLTMHPQCIGRGSRIRVLEKILSYGTEINAWMPRGRDLVEHVSSTSRRQELGITVRRYIEY